MSDGEVNRNTIEGQTTGTGAPKETFGSGRAAQSEAGKKANRSEEALKEAGRKAARTRAERYGEELKVSAPENDDLQGTKTTAS
ncbi:hypothetical protein COCSUDRAFT_60816 [Coccomyxa subellipsoidea C-169]|uniref:SMP domain-containing protein n=1 Tax=Coccomyxa subellipsoidea (strain C-169) TaxID=574566 RepID=I0Z585_COCSC|nr:hypothetical protein COCSUDRAFT_60816 [Coccomyxa subellipsoidea C-169]EIE25804.1 hypothetical protein COCSUDRAFT_60816 [Coccomyxa subellipsoidea C-169]|eukprot:XP_005650348.1 hypothetical protein COCSUDRAFT_60816 [Coccomyxa subellipsoidea C-169]